MRKKYILYYSLTYSVPREEKRFRSFSICSEYKDDIDIWLPSLIMLPRSGSRQERFSLVVSVSRWFWMD